MNCQEFQSKSELLLRGALADARTRDAAASHEESCEACAARLADERALSTGLRALATGMKGAEASARVESALVAAFRARAASGGVEVLEGAGAAPAGNVVPLHAHGRARQWSRVRTAAVASLAAAASLALFVLVRPGAGVEEPRAGGGGVQRAMIEPPPGGPGGQPNPEMGKVDRAVIGDVAPDAPGVSRGKPARATFAPRARVVNAVHSAGGRSGSSGRPAADERPQEIATEFIPLMQGAQYRQAEEGHLVRVELPRSALASFGLPVNFEAAAGRVKADVLLGEDGTARAIRFVR